MLETLRAAAAIAGKDIQVELRTRTALLSALVFAILVLAILFFARDASTVSPLDMAPGALWITFVFSAMVGLNRAFLLEQENGALDGILLSGVPRPAIFLGKVLANLTFVGVIEAVSIPLFILFYDVPIWHRLPELMLIIAMATFAFVSIGTLLSAMVVRTRFAELMLPLLLLPFLVPPVVGAVQVTSRVLSGRPLAESIGWMKLLGAFDLAFFTLALILFEATLEE